MQDHKTVGMRWIGLGYLKKEKDDSCIQEYVKV